MNIFDGICTEFTPKYMRIHPGDKYALMYVLKNNQLYFETYNDEISLTNNYNTLIDHADIMYITAFKNIDMPRLKEINTDDNSN